jgi:hypothetical protein
LTSTVVQPLARQRSSRFASDFSSVSSRSAAVAATVERIPPPEAAMAA